MNNVIFIFGGWVTILVSILAILDFCQNGTAYSRGLTVTGPDAVIILIGEILAALIWGGYSVFKTYQYLRKKWKKESPINMDSK